MKSAPSSLSDLWRVRAGSLLNAELKTKLTEIFEKLRRHSTADEVEAPDLGGEARSPASPITPSIRMSRRKATPLSVRTSFDGRTARATTNKFDEDSLQRVVQASENLAKVQQPDPDLPADGGCDERPTSAKTGSSADFVRPQASAPGARRRRSKRSWRSRSVEPYHGRHLLVLRVSGGIFNSRGVVRLACADLC